MSTNTAKIVISSAANIAKTSAIDELLGKGVKSEEIVKGKSNSSSSQQKIGQRLESDGIFFDLQGCKFSGTTVTCDLIVTNNEDDRELYISYNTRIFDESGNQYNASLIELGNNRSDFEAWLILIKGIPTKLRLSFNEVSSGIRKITVLEIVGGTSNSRIKIQFRNITL